jgi:hypothetical protein
MFSEVADLSFMFGELMLPELARSNATSNIS